MESSPRSARGGYRHVQAQTTLLVTTMLRFSTRHPIARAYRQWLRQFQRIYTSHKRGFRFRSFFLFFFFFFTFFTWSRGGDDLDLLRVKHVGGDEREDAWCRRRRRGRRGVEGRGREGGGEGCHVRTRTRNWPAFLTVEDRSTATPATRDLPKSEQGHTSEPKST